MRCCIDGEGDYEEGDDLLSEITSDTTFFDDDGSSRATYTSSSSIGQQFNTANQNNSSNNNASKENWSFTPYRVEGKTIILGEWVAKTKSYRYAVIGPDWPCVLITYVFIVIPGVFSYLYLVHNIVEEVLFFLLFGICLFGLTTVVFIDPGLGKRNFREISLSSGMLML
jgi:hypothetical protein